MDNSKTYNMKIVVNKTGISPFLLRAWETRYKAVSPERTETNRRLYSEADIEKLSHLKELTEMGFNIGSIAHLDLEELKNLLNKTSTPEKTEAKEKVSEFTFMDKCLLASKELDAKELEALLLKASVEYSQQRLIDEVIVPLMTQIGEDWRSGSLRVVNEHLAATVVRKFLLNMVDGYRVQPNAPSIIISTPYGQYHEIGALIGATAAASEGWNVTYLGSSLAAEEIALGAAKLKAQVVFLSIIYPYDDPNLKEEIRKLGIMLDKNVNIVVSGQGSFGYKNYLDEIGAIYINSHEELRRVLTNIRYRNYNKY